MVCIGYLQYKYHAYVEPRGKKKQMFASRAAAGMRNQQIVMDRQGLEHPSTELPNLSRESPEAVRYRKQPGRSASSSLRLTSILTQSQPRTALSTFSRLLLPKMADYIVVFAKAKT